MSNSSEPVYVSLEFTPNPNTLKYLVNRPVLGRLGAENFTQADDAAERSPLAAKLFQVEGIGGVMLGRDFVTVTKTDAGDWDLVHRSAQKIVEEHLASGEPVLTGESSETQAPRGGLEGQIRDILDREVRPAVAMDGGDITFDRFEDGVVYLELKGSCSGCPSSTATLKQGIEARLRELIPEVREVVSI